MGLGYSENGTLKKAPKSLYDFDKWGSTKFAILTRSRQSREFEKKAKEGYLIGYSLKSKAFQVYIKSSKIFIESINIRFDESSASEQLSSGLKLQPLASRQNSVEPIPNKTFNYDSSTKSNLDSLFKDAFDITWDILADYEIFVLPKMNEPVVPIPQVTQISGPSEVGCSTSNVVQHEYVEDTKSEPIQAEAQTQPEIVQSDIDQSKSSLPAIEAKHSKIQDEEESDTQAEVNSEIQTITNEYDVQNNLNDVQPLSCTHKWTKEHPPTQIIGNVNDRVKTRFATTNECLFVNSFSAIEPKNPSEALQDLD
ncbi:uncharacterized protein LOC112499950 [Cynara cardunculus var. scolymus]|uniref:uncharacterized protein LOC112499950 n=1 Tax=Cynara cardunculus var. scolymus TaxID=59895 RepID=UPI000D630CAD|nr:uncharacterized protein LOC112499950 [Cynara cardunculus var. scolymus]